MTTHTFPLNKQQYEKSLSLVLVFWQKDEEMLHFPGKLYTITGYAGGKT
jgi:hypothetical protein